MLLGCSQLVIRPLLVARRRYRTCRFMTKAINFIGLASDHAAAVGTRSVLYDEVNIEDNVYIKPMTALTGKISATVDHQFVENKCFSWHQLVYQLICLICLISIHGTILGFIHIIYQYCIRFCIPLPLSVAFVWLLWSMISVSVVMLLLKFLVGSTRPGLYRVNSYYYLHKLWLRQLIISSFNHSFVLFPILSTLSPTLLRWLGTHIGKNVKLGVFQQILQFPSNLLKIDCNVSTFGGVMLAPFEMTHSGHCHVDCISLGSNANLGNRCTLMPGSQLELDSMVGTLTLVTRKTCFSSAGAVLLGVPGRQMPFTLLDKTPHTNDASLSESPDFMSLLYPCLCFFASKSLLISLHWSLPTSIAPFVHTILFCMIHRCSTSNQRTDGRFIYSEIINYTQQLLNSAMVDFYIFIAPFLSRTQFLVFLYRALGARIGRDVILSDISCLLDPQLVTVGDSVRFNTGASIQCHTFERRVFKLASVTINYSSVLMSASVVLPGATFNGRNRLMPLTLVMKNDRLPYNTTWTGVPARQLQ